MRLKPHAYVTYFDQRYVARAHVMLRSLRRHDPGAEIFALCLDEPAQKLTAALHDRKLVVVLPQELYVFDPALAACSTRGTAAFRATHKPALAHYVLHRRPDLASIAHIDADVCFFSSPAPLFAEIGEASIALSPHRFVTNLERARWFGQFNAGFIYWRNDPLGRRCLTDYRADCIAWCEPHGTGNGRFMNQGYLTAWPQRYPGVHVIQHPGVNLAPWNIAGHAVSDLFGVRVDRVLLVFFHFSGLVQGPDGIWCTGYTEFGNNLEIARRAVYVPYLRRVERTQSRADQHWPGLLPAQSVWKWTNVTELRRQPKLPGWAAAVFHNKVKTT